MTVRMNDTISQMCILYIRVNQMQTQTTLKIYGYVCIKRKIKKVKRGRNYLGLSGNDLSTKPDQEQLSDQRRLSANILFQKKKFY